MSTPASASQRQNLILLHNDTPALTSYTAWRVLNKLVFRGARTAYAELNQAGFAAINDDRFPMRCIIRDSWKARKVMTRMQTKSVLAWSKSFSKALEYAAGSIQGGLSGVKPGNLYFGCVDRGVDVTDEVRRFEAKFKLPPIDEGTQKEVLTPTLPKNRILACWQLLKGKAGFGHVIISSKTTYPGVFSAEVLQAYQLIDQLCPSGKDFDFYLLGEKINQQLGVSNK